MLFSADNLFAWLMLYPFALYLMVDSGTDFTFRRPQMLFSWQEKHWIEYEGSVLWLLLVRFLMGCFVIVASGQFLAQVVLIGLLLLLEILAGRLYLPKVKR